MEVHTHTSSAKSPDLAVLNKQFPNCFFQYPVRDRMHTTSKSGDFEEQSKCIVANNFEIR